MLSRENISILNKLKASFVVTETVGTGSTDVTVDVQNGEIFVPSIADIDAEAQSRLGDAITVLLDYSAKDTHFSVGPAFNAYYDYITANEAIKPEAYRKAVDAISDSLDTAMDMQQAKGGDISTLQKLKAQVETDKNSYATYGRQAITQSEVTKVPQTETLADVVDMLIRVSRGMPTDLGIAALHDAHYHGYLTGGGDIKPAVDLEGDKALLWEMKERLESVDRLRGKSNNGTTEIRGFDIRIIASLLKTEKDTAYFWSGKSNGIGGKDFVMKYAEENGGTTLELLMERKGIKMPIWDNSDPNSIKAWENASAEYAKQASGVVRAIIGSKVRPESVWLRIELNALKANPNVTKIIVIDPDTQIETVIFRRKI